MVRDMGVSGPVYGEGIALWVMKGTILVKKGN